MSTSAMPWSLPSNRTIAATLMSIALHGALSSVAGRAPQPAVVPLAALAIEMLPPEEVEAALPPEEEAQQPEEPAPKPEEPAPSPVVREAPEPEPEEPEVHEPEVEPVTEESPSDATAVDTDDDSLPSALPEANGDDLLSPGTGLSIGARPASGRRAARRTGRSPQSSTKAPAPTAPVPLADLSVRPTPPALDALLKQNYPRGARLQGRPGTARVALLIGQDGRVLAVRPVSASEPEFGAACKKTLLDSRWSLPRDADGRPVPTIIPYECRFEVTR